MKAPRFLFFVGLLSLFETAFAKPLELMTPRDLLSDNSLSGIRLQNNRQTATDVFGIYIRQYSYVTPGASCDSATIMYPASQNVAAGSVVAPTTIGANKSADVGANYLYNMIIQAIYYLNILVPSSPPGCALPGCTWGTDTTKYDWCIYMGALAPVVTTAGYTSNVSPSTNSTSGGGYNYNLISSYVYLGPISCDDQTTTCRVSTPQTQSFS